jgi:hypothetical protein
MRAAAALAAVAASMLAGCVSVPDPVAPANPGRPAGALRTFDCGGADAGQRWWMLRFRGAAGPFVQLEKFRRDAQGAWTFVGSAWYPVREPLRNLRCVPEGEGVAVYAGPGGCEPHWCPVMLHVDKDFNVEAGLLIVD